MESSGDPFVVSVNAVIIYTWVVYSVLCQMINVFGIVTNIINIVCFVKQGFKDSVNISLLGLSFSDLGSHATVVWTCFSLTPAVAAADLPFDTFEVMYLTSGIAHLSFARISSCITAVITLERCLCITYPLEIKSIITPKRTTFITVAVFIFFFFTSSPIYAVNSLGMKMSAIRNKTILGLHFSENRENVEKIAFAINNFAIPFAAFVIIVICTTILAVELRRKVRWRKAAIVSTCDCSISNRNMKTAKMVVMMSTLFIVCFIPLNIIMLAVGFLPVLSLNGKYVNISIMIGGISYILEGINASSNIFIYYNMSTKYRETCQKLLCLKKT